MDRASTLWLDNPVDVRRLTAPSRGAIAVRRFASIISTVVVAFALIQTPGQARGSDHKGSGLRFTWARPSGPTVPRVGGRPAQWHPLDAKAYGQAKALANARAAARSRHPHPGAATPSTVAGVTSPVPGPSCE